MPKRRDGGKHGHRQPTASSAAGMRVPLLLICRFTTHQNSSSSRILHTLIICDTKFPVCRTKRKTQLYRYIKVYHFGWHGCSTRQGRGRTVQSCHGRASTNHRNAWRRRVRVVDLEAAAPTSSIGAPDANLLLFRHQSRDNSE